MIQGEITRFIWIKVDEDDSEMIKLPWKRRLMPLN